MGFFYKYLFHPMLSKVTGHKAFTNNPYLGFILDAGDNAIADELFSVSLAYQHGHYSLPQDKTAKLKIMGTVLLIHFKRRYKN